MFIVGIFGGLASQMNQFAFLLELRRRFPGVETKMAIASDWMVEGQHNGYELDRVFGIKADRAKKKDIIKCANFYPGTGVYSQIRNRMLMYRNKIIGCKASQITYEDPTVFHDEVFSVDTQRNCLFWGNWMHEDYFNNSADGIRHSYIFPHTLGKENQEVAKEIINSKSISIHVRRGDYEKYGFFILPIAYYKKAVEIMSQSVDHPKYFIFSDDKDYIKKTFDFLDDPVIVTNNTGKNSYIDMQLMSMCKHNIIANSGFSFWGAWLNPNPEKIVIAPNKHVPWCKNPIALNEWIKVEA